MGLGAPKIVHDQDFRDISSVKQGTLGGYAETVDGRGYRYSLAGGSNLAPGKINVAETVDTDATNKTVARTYSAGAVEIIIDAGGAVAADRYADGYLSITDATGEGVTMLVKSNTVTTGAAEMTVRLYDPLPVALTIDVSEASLTANPWSGVVVSVADQLDMAVGIANVTVTAAYYHWEQTKGVCAALADESYAIGQELVIGSSVVGALEAHDAAGEQTVAVAIVAGVDTEYREVYLNID
jgi:hypothetical protein